MKTKNEKVITEEIAVKMREIRQILIDNNCLQHLSMCIYGGGSFNFNNAYWRKETYTKGLTISYSEGEPNESK